MNVETTVAMDVDVRPVQERRRRGRPRHRDIQLADMCREQGRPLTPRALAQLSGMSDDKIRVLLRTGYLKGIPVPSAAGVRFQWRIPYLEAQRWLRQLRVL